MKVRLQDVIKNCIDIDACCTGCNCKYTKDGECLAKIDGYYPFELENYYRLCGNSPELAKALYTNEEIELHENDSERTD